MAFSYSTPSSTKPHADRADTEQRHRRSSIFGAVRKAFAFCVLIALVAVPAQTGCKAGEPEMTNGQILEATQISKQLRAMCGDDSYAVVQTKWLTWYYGQFRSDLARGPFGIVRWFDSFDCNRFVAKFAADAQVRFFSHSFHNYTHAKALAVGEFWYTPAKGARSHAIVFAYTEQGLVFIDPQTGKFLPLTSGEINSHTLAKI